MVLATQNPIEYEGTYPLPEAQLDRFTMRLSLGYPALADEARMLTEQTSDPPLDALEPVCDADDVIAAGRGREGASTSRRASTATSSPSSAHTRADPRLYLGASPRARDRAAAVAKARALADGRDFVSPDDVKAVAVAVLAHRLIVAPEARSSGLGPERARPGRDREDTRSGVTARGRLALALGAAIYLAGLGVRFASARSGRDRAAPRRARRVAERSIDRASGRGAAHDADRAARG